MSRKRTVIVSVSRAVGRDAREENILEYLPPFSSAKGVDNPFPTLMPVSPSCQKAVLRENYMARWTPRRGNPRVRNRSVLLAPDPRKLHKSICRRREKESWRNSRENGDFRSGIVLVICLNFDVSVVKSMRRIFAGSALNHGTSI